MVPVTYGQGLSQGVGWTKGMYILPLGIFKHVFDVGLYNFFIISNLFDSNKPYVKHA